MPDNEYQKQAIAWQVLASSFLTLSVTWDGKKQEPLTFFIGGDKEKPITDVEILGRLLAKGYELTLQADRLVIRDVSKGESFLYDFNTSKLSRQPLITPGPGPYATEEEALIAQKKNPDLSKLVPQWQPANRYPGDTEGAWWLVAPQQEQEKQPLAGPQFTVGEDGNVYRRDVVDGAWKLVEAQDVPSLDDEIDRLILEGTPEAMAEASRLYQAKQRVTGAAERERQATAEKQQAQATQRFNQALQLVDLAQNDPARLDMVLKLLQQSGLWPFDGSMDPLQAVQQQVQQAPGFVQGFGSQAQRQAAVEENIRRQETGQPPITLGQVEAFAQKGVFGAGPQVRPPDFGPGGEVLDIGFIPGPEGLPPSPPEGLLPPGMNLPGMAGQPSFEDAAAQFNQQLIGAMTSGQITEPQRNQAWQEFLDQWQANRPAEVTAAIPGAAPGGPTFGYNPETGKFDLPITVTPAFGDMPAGSMPFRPLAGVDALGRPTQQGGAPPTVGATGNKFVDWLKVIQDQAKERARAEAQKSNRLGQTFARPMAGGSVRYG